MKLNESVKKSIRETFQKIRTQASAFWQKTREEGVPYVLVGMATCGRASGSMQVFKAFQEELTEHHLSAHVIPVGCMGHCYAEPLIGVRKPGWPLILYRNVSPPVATTIVKHFLRDDNVLPELALAAFEPNDFLPSLADFPRFALETRTILRDFGLVNPENIMDYIARGGYEGLSMALQREQKTIIDQVRASGLRGLGGAGFLTGEKWEACFRAKGNEKFVICNADEGDPGAFSDRAVIESSPHQVLEGMIIAGYAVSASYGYIYIRHEYPLAVQRMRSALQQARSEGLLGKKILGSDFNFDITVFEGSGAFVCGEETALIQSLEGKRGMPRPRPPYPALSGFKDAPTLINNVKTLAAVPSIMQSAPNFASIGTERSKGTAIFSIAGKINNTGLVEVAMGTTLKKLVFDICGGIPKNKKFKAIQIGGPSGGCLSPEFLNTPIDFDSLKEAGAMMGSGGMVVLDEDDCMVDVAKYFLDFTERESCGKCTFCRIGTKQMLLILQDITEGKGKPEDIETLRDLAEDVRRGSLCGLGKTAPNPVLTTLAFFHDEYEAHITEKRCPAHVCRKLIAFYILPDKCERSCDVCVGSCPTEAIYTAKRRIKAIDQEKCVKCGACLDVCPVQYSAVVTFSPADSVPPAPEKLREKK